MQFDAPNNGWFVDPACPLEWGHPLNRGLVGNQSVPPNAGWRGGKTLRDLVRGGRKPTDGTLTSGPAWSGLGPGSGLGSVDTSAAGYVALTTAPFLSLTKLTVGFWVRPTTNSLGGSDRYLWGAAGDRWRVRTAFATIDGLLFQAQYGSGSTVSDFIASGSGLSVGVWSPVIFDHDGTTANIYVGNMATAKITLSAAGAPDFANFSDGLAALGARSDGVSPLPARYTENCVWDRVLSAGQRAAWVAETRRGNPERWRWVGRQTYFGPTAGGATFDPSGGFPWPIHHAPKRDTLAAVAY